MKSRPSDLRGGLTLLVHNLNSIAGTLVLSPSCLSQKPAANPKLVFYRYGQQYFLAEVWNRNSSVGSQIKTSSRQTELAEPIERRGRADRGGEVMMLAQFHFKPGGSPWEPPRFVSVVPPQKHADRQPHPYPHLIRNPSDCYEAPLGKAKTVSFRPCFSNAS
jgi:hypothetical protein